MGMFSEIATEGVVCSIAEFVKKELSKETDAAARDALKRVGRHVLKQLESSPGWEAEYTEAFK